MRIKRLVIIYLLTFSINNHHVSQTRHDEVTLSLTISWCITALQQGTADLWSIHCFPLSYTASISFRQDEMMTRCLLHISCSHQPFWYSLILQIRRCISRENPQNCAENEDFWSTSMYRVFRSATAVIGPGRFISTPFVPADEPLSYGAKPGFSGEWLGVRIKRTGRAKRWLVAEDHGVKKHDQKIQSETDRLWYWGLKCCTKQDKKMWCVIFEVCRVYIV